MSTNVIASTQTRRIASNNCLLQARCHNEPSRKRSYSRMYSSIGFAVRSADPRYREHSPPADRKGVPSRGASSCRRRTPTPTVARSSRHPGPSTGSSTAQARGRRLPELLPWSVLAFLMSMLRPTRPLRAPRQCDLPLNRRSPVAHPCRHRARKRAADPGRRGENR